MRQQLQPTLHGLVLHGGDMLEARWWYIPVFTDLLLLLVAGGTTGKGGGESGAGRPQSDQRWACEHPRLPSAPHQECSALQEGEDLGQGRTQAWGRVLVSRQVESLPQCLGWGWTRAGYTGARGGAKGVDIRVEGAGREAHINPPCSSLAPLVKGLLGGGRERYGEG